VFCDGYYTGYAGDDRRKTQMTHADVWQKHMRIKSMRSAARVSPLGRAAFGWRVVAPVPVRLRMQIRRGSPRTHPENEKAPIDMAAQRSCRLVYEFTAEFLGNQKFHQP
jgi:hypothetical protein